jgi:IS605 OrfB family transposase
MQSSHRSYEIVINPDSTQLESLENFACKWNQEQRRFYKAQQANPNLDLNQYKRDFIAKTKLTGRHFNSLRDDLKAKKDSVFELMKSRLEDLKDRLPKLNKTIKSLSHRSNRLSIKDKQSLFNKTRKLNQTQHQIQELEQALKQKDAQLCFGSKRLFQAQFNHQQLNKNNPNQFENFNTWLDAWKSARTATFCMIGSKDESFGNSNCQLKLDTTDAVSGILQINTGTEKLKVPVTLKYGSEFIQAGLKNSQALTYRFNRDTKNNRWRVRVSLDVAQVKTEIKTYKQIGVVAVDINSDHLAVVDLDRFGNVLQRLTIDLNLYGKSTEQAKAITGDAIKELVSYAEAQSKPIVIEDLNFEQKRRNLKSTDSAKYKRMLSSFSYNRIINLIRARAMDKGIELLQVNPAYTSQIGRLKYMQRLALSSHHAAAMVIGRRGMEFTEKLFKVAQAHTTSAVPARNQYKSRYAYLKAVFSKIRAPAVQSPKTVISGVDDSTFGSLPSPTCGLSDHGDFRFATNLASVAVSLA